jgi:hypothetical protein
MANQSPPPGWGEQEPPGYQGGPPSYPSYPGPGGYGPPQPGYGYGGYPGPQNPQSSTPTVLSVIGIVCWFLCSPAAIVLGLVAQSKFRAQGRSDTLAKVAWIGGIVLLALGIIFFVASKGRG